jgi:hypothetical protein
MKRMLIIVMLFSAPYVTTAQRRTVIVPAPQPPNVPIDGGISLLLLGGGIWGRNEIRKSISNNK